MTKVLLIEDDPQISASLSKVLRNQGRVVTTAEHGTVGLQKLVDDQPDVIVLDLGLPDVDGMDVLRMIRGLSDTPLIVATARDDEATIVRALDLGADEYVVKPFSGRQLDARIRALLRRGGTRVPEVMTIGDLGIDVGARVVKLGGRQLDLRRKEFDLLTLLASRMGEVVTRAEIAQEVWDDPHSASDATIDVHLSALRRHLGESAASPRYLRAVRGVGVKIVDPEHE